MQLNNEQMIWLQALNVTSGKQAHEDLKDGKKAFILDKMAEQREQHMDEILEGYQFKVGRIGKNGKFQTMDVSREDLDPTKMFDVADQDLGYRVANEDGTDFDEIDIEDPEHSKFDKATNLLEMLSRDANHSYLTDDGRVIIGKGKEGTEGVEKLFTDDELTEEVYDPLVRRGVPETFIGNKHSRNDAMVKGSMKHYAERLEKEDLKGFAAENKDLGVAFFRLCISAPGNIMGGLEATKLDVSQQQTTGGSPIQGFQQAFGITANDDGSMANNLEKVSQTWAFIQNASDIVFDGGLETSSNVQEIREQNKSLKKGSTGDEDEDGEAPKPDKRQAIPMVTQSVVAAMALQVGAALAPIGKAGSTIFGSSVDRSKIANLLIKPDVADGDITSVVNLLAAALKTALTTLCSKTPPVPAEVTNAIDKAKTALTGAITPADVVKALEDEKYEEVISLFNTAAQAAGASLKNELDAFLKKPKVATDMKRRAANYVTKQLKEANEKAKSKEEKQHDEDMKTKPEKDRHDADFVTSGGKSVCLRCSTDLKDVNLFAGMLEQKIADMKKDQAYFTMAVNLGGMGFDVASNFLAPLAMGGALLRMSQFIFKAVKRWVDFSNFCDSKKAMINSASAYSAPIRRFRDDARSQGIHYSVNAACEGAKIVAAALQCTPAVIGGIIAAQAASGVEALEAVIYELDKRVKLELAWRAYKKALNNPENRRLGLIAMRKNPTLAKYAMAWGAVVRKDPLVDDFISHCGINSDTLRGNANIDKVVEYLEARMPDDIQVVGRRPGTTVEWAPTQVTLTADSWIDAKTRGETTGNVAAIDTSAIESALVKYEEADAKLTTAQNKTSPKAKSIEAKKKAAFQSLRMFRKALASYKPKNTKSKRLDQPMQEVVKLFISEAEIKQNALRV
jgi:hypothetical protein